MAHTILLVQPGIKPETRTYSDYESVSLVMAMVDCDDCNYYAEVVGVGDGDGDKVISHKK